MFEWMAWTLPVAVFFTCIVADAGRHDGLGAALADGRCARASCRWRRRAATASSSACWPPPTEPRLRRPERADGRLVRPGAGAFGLDRLRRLDARARR